MKQLIEVDEPTAYVHYEPGKWIPLMFKLIGVAALLLITLSFILGAVVAYTIYGG